VTVNCNHLDREKEHEQIAWTGQIAVWSRAVSAWLCRRAAVLAAHFEMNQMNRDGDSGDSLPRDLSMPISSRERYLSPEVRCDQLHLTDASKNFV